MPSCGCSLEILFTSKAQVHPGSKLSSAPSIAIVKHMPHDVVVIQQQLLTLPRHFSYFGCLRCTASCLGWHGHATSFLPTAAVANFAFIALKRDPADVTDSSGV